MGSPVDSLAPARPRRAWLGLRLAWLAVAVAGILFAILGATGWFGGPLYAEVAAAPGRAPPRAAVLLLSGDMGFRLGMGGRVAARLAARGIPVIGVNSLAYFHRPRSAAEAAGLIRDGIARTRAFAPGAPLVLIGQSFGADMLQVGLARMPPPQRRGIALVALVVPSRQVRMQASPGGLIAVDGPGFDGLSTAQALGWAPTLCISGEDERTSLCPSLRQANVARLALPGGHLLRFDADRLAAALLAAIDRATDPRPESPR